MPLCEPLALAVLAELIARQFKTHCFRCSWTHTLKIDLVHGLCWILTIKTFLFYILGKLVLSDGLLGEYKWQYSPNKKNPYYHSILARPITLDYDNMSDWVDWLAVCDVGATDPVSTILLCSVCPT